MWKCAIGMTFGLVVLILGTVPRIRPEFAARLVYSTIVGDRFLRNALKTYKQVRAALVLGFLSDSAIQRLGILGYAETKSYGLREDLSWPELNDWEVSFLDRYLSAPPGRVLVGGAGAGREPYHLAKMGYDIVAFDPNPTFVEMMRRDIPAGLPVRSYQASYEDLPLLAPATSQEQAADLTTMPPFDAAILGHSSFSHILDDANLLRTLKLLACVVTGPILISFTSRDSVADTPNSRLDRWLRRLPGRNQDPTIGFRLEIGAYRQFIAQEMIELCTSAGLYIIELRVKKHFSHSSYVVVRAMA